MRPVAAMGTEVLFRNFPPVVTPNTALGLATTISNQYQCQSYPSISCSNFSTDGGIARTFDISVGALLIYNSSSPIQVYAMTDGQGSNNNAAGDAALLCEFYVKRFIDRTRLLVPAVGAPDAVCLMQSGAGVDSRAIVRTVHAMLYLHAAGMVSHLNQLAACRTLLPPCTACTAVYCMPYVPNPARAVPPASSSSHPPTLATHNGPCPLLLVVLPQVRPACRARMRALHTPQAPSPTHTPNLRAVRAVPCLQTCPPLTPCSTRTRSRPSQARSTTWCCKSCSRAPAPTAW